MTAQEITWAPQSVTLALKYYSIKGSNLVRNKASPKEKYYVIHKGVCWTLFLYQDFILS